MCFWKEIHFGQTGTEGKCDTNYEMLPQPSPLQQYFFPILQLDMNITH